MQKLSKHVFYNLLQEQILIFDGAMGTNLQNQNLTPDDYGGKLGCSEALNLYSPHKVRNVHLSFLSVGCQVIETNTFNATRIALSEYGLENYVEEINQRAVYIAKEAVEEYQSKLNYQLYIAGSIGPTSKLPSFQTISFDQLYLAYCEQIEFLLKAGVDLLIIETCQDLLQAKSALLAASNVFKKQNKSLPIIVSVTIQPNGLMLAGSDVSVISTVLESFDIIDAIGFNCSTGPAEMDKWIEKLCQLSTKPVSIMPNAGLPENINGKPVYKLTPDEFSSFIYKFVCNYGVNIVGGCCGTTPAHLQATINKIKNIKPIKRNIKFQPSVASLFISLPLKQEPPPCIIGERTNATGSKVFKEYILNNNFEGMIKIAKEQIETGAHILDVSVCLPNRDEVEDLTKIIKKFALQIKLPIMIDSTNPEAIRSALKNYAGKCIINSVNLEDGGHKLREIAQIAKDFGASLVCLAIDENGMAKDAETKIKILTKIYSILTNEFNFKPYEIIFDPLTFCITSGSPEVRNAAKETLKAIEFLSQNFPNSFTILGISNISYGLIPEARSVLNSVFLSEAVKKGLTMAILHPSSIQPIFKIPHNQIEAALNLIYNNHQDGSDLTYFISLFSLKTSTTPILQNASKSDNYEEILYNKILDGNKNDLLNIIMNLLNKHSPNEVINNFIIKAMKDVGKMFESGLMPLPFVLQSAEVVKTAVDYLKPYLSNQPIDNSKTIILATVAGDVHDIGKNLVKIIFENNGYNVIDLGIKVDIETMIENAEKHNTNVIAMSGLLVKSTQVMYENILELNKRGLKYHVILGGAALTKQFVENLQKIYIGKVYYAQDAFDGLNILKNIFSNNSITQ